MRIKLTNLSLLAILLFVLAGIGCENNSKEVSGVWVLSEAVCPGTCESWYWKRVQNLKGKEMILNSDRFVDPIGVVADCESGVRFDYLKLQPGNRFIRELPIEVDGHGARNNFDPSKLGVSGKEILAGYLTCRRSGQFTAFLPAANKLYLYLEGGVFAGFEKKK